MRGAVPQHAARGEGHGILTHVDIDLELERPPQEYRYRQADTDQHGEIEARSQHQRGHERAMNLRTVRIVDGAGELAGAQILLPRAAVTAAAAEGADTVTLGFRPDELHTFSTKTGRALAT